MATNKGDSFPIGDIKLMQELELKGYIQDVEMKNTQLANIVAKTTEMSDKLHKRDQKIIALQSMLSPMEHRNLELESKLALLHKAMPSENTPRPREHEVMTCEEGQQDIQNDKARRVDDNQYIWARHHSEMHELKVQLSRCVQNCELKSSQIAQIMDTNKELLVQLQERDCHLIALQNEANAIKRKNRELIFCLDSHEISSKGSTDSHVNQVPSCQLSPTDDNDSQHPKCAESTYNIVSTQNELAILTTKLGTLEETVAQLQEEKDRVLEKYEMAKLEAETFKSDFEEERRDRSRAHEQIDSLRQEISKLRKENVSYQPQFLKVKISEMELKRSLTRLKSNYDKEVKDLRNRTKLQERELQKATEQMKRDSFTVVQAKARLDNANKEIAKIKSKVKSKTGDGKKLGSQLKSRSSNFLDSCSWEDVEVSIPPANDGVGDREKSELSIYKRHMSDPAKHSIVDLQTPSGGDHYEPCVRMRVTSSPEPSCLENYNKRCASSKKDHQLTHQQLTDERNSVRSEVIIRISPESDAVESSYKKQNLEVGDESEAENTYLKNILPESSYAPKEGNRDLKLIHQENEDIKDMCNNMEALSHEKQIRKNTIPDMPYDDNLICSICQKQFRHGEIQKFRHHVDDCKCVNDVFT